MRWYETTEGDVLDEIVHRFYGQADGALERVLEENPRLAGQGLQLPQGVVIRLPDLPPASPKAVVRLWT